MYKPAKWKSVSNFFNREQCLTECHTSNHGVLQALLTYDEAVGLLSNRNLRIRKYKATVIRSELPKVKWQLIYFTYFLMYLMNSILYLDLDKSMASSSELCEYHHPPSKIVNA
jgi:hypothetical protein